MVEYLDSKCNFNYLANSILNISLKFHDMAGGVELGERLLAVNHCL